MILGTVYEVKKGKLKTKEMKKHKDMRFSKEDHRQGQRRQVVDCIWETLEILERIEILEASKHEICTVPICKTAWCQVQPLYDLLTWT